METDLCIWKETYVYGFSELFFCDVDKFSSREADVFCMRNVFARILSIQKNSPETTRLFFI